MQQNNRFFQAGDAEFGACPPGNNRFTFGKETAPAAAGDKPSVALDEVCKRIGVQKDGHSYLVEYAAESETEALCSLLSMALDSRFNFDMDDAAFVMHILSRAKGSPASLE